MTSTPPARHQGPITAIQFSADGKRLVSASWDNTLGVWDSQTGSRLRTLSGHSQVPKHLALGADGRTVLSAGRDELKLWDLETGACLASYAAPGEVHSLVLSANGRRAAIFTYLQKTRILALARLNLTTGRWSVSPAKSAIFASSGRRAITGDGAGTVKIWDLVGNRWIGSLFTWREGLLAAALSPDGRWAAGWTDGTPLQPGRQLVAWDLRWRRRIAQRKTLRPFLISSDGQRLVSLRKGDENNHTLHLFDLRSGEHLWYSPQVVASQAITPDARRFALDARQEVAIWEIADQHSAQCLCRFSGLPVRRLGADEEGLALDESGLTLAWAVDTNVWFFKLENAAPRTPIRSARRTFALHRFWKGLALRVECPACCAQQEIKSSDLGQVVECVRCGQRVKVNT